MRLRARHFLALTLTVLAAQHLAIRPAQASVVRWTLSASGGFGYEVHPIRHVQAENVMLTLGVGLLRDMVRFELGAVSAYGALAAMRPREIHAELRPMVRFALPLIPLYARLVFAGLNPFGRDAHIAYGGALGLNIPLGPLALFAEAGTLPRHIDHREHWILEARLGLACKL